MSNNSHLAGLLTGPAHVPADRFSPKTRQSRKGSSGSRLDCGLG